MNNLKSGIEAVSEKVKDVSRKFLLNPFIRATSAIHYPGEEHTSIYQILNFFFHGLMKGSIQARARAISFSFFLALFPSIIFLFTLIPYIPINNLDIRIIGLLQEIMPVNTFEATKSTIEDILIQPRGGLLSIGFLVALYVSTNGVFSMIEGFNQSYHGLQTRSAFGQRMISIFLTGLLSLIIIFSISLIVVSEYASSYLLQQNLLTNNSQYYLLQSGKWVILIMMSLFAISSLYYYGPSKFNRRPFISVGSVTATVLILATSLLFNFFISNFAVYNKVYGSIGTLIIILVWINVNSMQLILGFELNASIENALSSNDEENIAYKEVD
jgi:membrane protein